jgi:D-alanyl-D-alanine carboxypeptidase (penicillin-binding protein 5/6)
LLNFDLMARRSRLLHLCQTALLLGCVLLASGCKDPKREAELQAREQKAQAHEKQLQAQEQELAKRSEALQQREADLAKAQQAIKDQQAEMEKRLKAMEDRMAKQEADLTQRHKELDRMEAEMKAAKVAYEMKVRRGPAPSVTSERILVLDAQSNEVLYERNPDKRNAIASTTKILTATIIIETGDMDKEVVIEESDTICAPVKMGLKTGEKYTRRDLLTALMVKSSNDIAQALARDNAGSVEAFVEKMNARAKELGCEDSLFINPNGLPPVNDQVDPYSTPRDLAKIAMHADKLDDLRAMVKLKTYTFKKGDGKSVVLENTNRVLRTCEFCDGMKTGYTQAAGHCLVCTGERDGKRRIVVVLNGTPTGVWKDAESLLLWSLK